MDTSRPCLTCWAMVPARAVEQHEQWHENISRVAIESTQRIDALTARLQEVLDARV